MSDVLADTPDLVWSRFDPDRLSRPALSALTKASQVGRIFISTVTLVELNYLANRPTFPYPDAFPQVLSLVANPDEPLQTLPLSLGVVQTLDRVPRGEVPDMPDRIIAATAVCYRLPLVSSDEAVRTSAGLNAHVSVIW